jgi:hypothetical protein
MTRRVLIDPAAGALAVGRARATVDWWAHRGWLTKYGTRRARRYDLAELHDVAADLDAGRTPTTKEPRP